MLFRDYTRTFFQNRSLFLADEYDSSSMYKHKDINLKSLLNNKVWLYSFTENFFVFSYDANIYIYPFLEHTFTRNRMLTVLGGSNSVMYVQVLDMMCRLYVIKLPYLSPFFHKLTDNWDFMNIVNMHPEYYVMYRFYYLRFLHHFSGNLFTAISIFNITESFITPPMVAFNLVAIFFAVVVFLAIFFNYYTGFVKEDNIIDHDFLSVNVTIEAEEEIGSMDDMLMSAVILIYIFFWFFWIYSWSSLSIVPALSMTIVLFPLLYFIILFIPFSLLYDYGSYFLTYLNGVSKSSTMIVEFLFDSIAVSIFFLRLTVQNVRLVFMLFTFTELHEMIINFFNDRNMIVFNEFFNEAWEKVKTAIDIKNYSIIFNAPINLLRWLYELFHTFFMLIFQFVAFFAMIFWLFLFLYSMFVSETQENYFSVKRKLKQTSFKKLISLKKSSKKTA